MDAKITKKRLNNLFSYDWVKILLSIVGGILVWSLIFTMTATKISPSQQFTVLNYVGNVSLDSTKFDQLFSDAAKNDVFSYEVVETNVRDATLMSGGMESQLMQATLGTDEGDVIFVPNIPDKSTAYVENEDGSAVDGSDADSSAEGEVKYKRTYAEALLYSEYRYVADLNPTSEKGFFQKMEQFLNLFYTEGFENADSLDEAAVKTAFRARVRSTKDKRFKTEAQIQEGEKLEIARVKKYRDALVKMQGYIDTGVVELVPITIESGKETYTKWMMDLCPDARMEKLVDYVAYETTYLGEDGKENKKNVANHMMVAFLDLPGVQESFEYESVPFIVYLIDTVLAVSAK